MKKENKIRILLCWHKIYYFPKVISSVSSLLRFRMWRSESYFPELPNHKSQVRIFFELLLGILKTGALNVHYFTYGFDIKGLRQQNDYLDEQWFLWKSWMMNSIMPNWDYTCLLRDKNLFADYLTRWGYETPHVMYRIEGANHIKDVIDDMFAHRGGVFLQTRRWTMWERYI